MDPDKTLAEWKREHREIEAPAVLEVRLRAAVRAKRRSGAMAWFGALAGAAAALTVIFTLGRTIPVRPAPEVSPAVLAFLPLPGAEMLPAPMDTSILRVQLRKGELQRYGIEVTPAMNAELIAADFVVGDDGLARAIRLAGGEN